MRKVNGKMVCVMVAKRKEKDDKRPIFNANSTRKKRRNNSIFLLKSLFYWQFENNPGKVHFRFIYTYKYIIRIFVEYNTYSSTRIQ